MPIYDYVCHHCGHRFEVIHGLHDEGPRHCPVCHSKQVRKAFAAPAIHFKGSGWAKKDRSVTKAGASKKADDGADAPAAAGAGGDAGGAASSTTEAPAASSPPEKKGPSKPAAVSEGS